MLTGRTGLAAWTAAIAMVGALGSCKRAAETAEEAPPDSRPSSRPLGASEIWALAPENAAWGIVARDGALARLQGAIVAASGVAAGQDDARVLWATQVLPALEYTRLPLLDSAAMKEAGLDLARGGAVFFAADDSPVLAIVPVGDVEALATRAGLETKNMGGRAVYYQPGKPWRCAMKEQRMLCAMTIEQVDAALDSIEHPLASTATLVPRKARGDIEMLVDLTNHDRAREASHDAAPFWRSATTLAVALRLERGAGRVRAWMDGTPGPLLGELPGPLAPALQGLDVGSTGMTRARLPLDALLAMGSVPEQIPLSPTFDARRDLLDHLTGDVAVTSRGDQLGTIVAVARDPAALRGKLDEFCDVLASGDGIDRAASPADDCRLRLALARQNPLLAAFGQVEARLHVTDDALVMSSGTGTVPAVPVGPHAASLLDDDSRIVAWGRALDPLAGAPAQIGAALFALAPADARPGIRAARWAAGHIHVLAAALHTDSRGAYAELLVVTALADAPGVTRAYQDAVRANVEGDRAENQRLLAAIAREHPNSYAGRFARLLEGDGLALGFTAGIVAGIVVPSLARAANGAEAAQP